MSSFLQNEFTLSRVQLVHIAQVLLASIPMTVNSYVSLSIECELMIVLQASLMHCEVPDRTWPIFYRT